MMSPVSIDRTAATAVRAVVSAVVRAVVRAVGRSVLATSCTVLLMGCVELKQAGKTIGHASRDVAKEIGHASRDVAKGIGHGTKRVVKSIVDDEVEASDAE